MKIRTVKGIMEAGNFNYVDAHTHVWIKGREPKIKILSLKKAISLLIKSCLDDFKECNGSLLVDCTPFECGRDTNKLRDISFETGVEIVAVTGFHKRDYYPPDFKIWELIRRKQYLFYAGNYNGIQRNLR